MATIQPGALLGRLAEEYHHHKQENKEKAGPASQQRRRHLQDLVKLEQAFESLLERWVRNEAERQAWRGHFYHVEPAPSGPQLPEPPLFKGHTDDGGTVELRVAPGPAWELSVDGQPVHRMSQTPTLTERRIGRLRFDGVASNESFDAPGDALDALADYYDAPHNGAPWEHAPALYSEGLIDGNFGLTPRGQRWLDARRHRGEGGLDIWL